MPDLLLVAALVLAGVHFGVPLGYYWYAKKRWLLRPWSVRVDESYRPKVTIVVPTYNEAARTLEVVKSFAEVVERGLALK